MSVAVLIPTLAFVMGLLFGSFLNVCIARLPFDESIVSPRSRCPSGDHTIRWYDNIPLLSFAFLRARCRDCGAAISWQYPIVEFLTGLWFLLCSVSLLPALSLSAEALLLAAIQTLAACTLGFLLIGLMVIDWQHHLLPDALTYPGMLLGFLFVCTQAIFLGPNDYNLVLKHSPNINAANSGHSTGNVFLTGPEHLVMGRLVAMVGAFLILYLIRVLYRALRKRDGMGLGDAKLLAMIAAFIGFTPSLVALFVGVLAATAYAVTLLLRGKANAATRLPFGSFLAIGGLIAAIVGTRLADSYLALFR